MQKLDDMPKKDMKTILPYKDYNEDDIKLAADLITKMLKWVPSERISCSKALEHDFFKRVA